MYWLLATFGKNRFVVCEIVKSKFKPKKREFKVVYGPFQSKRLAADYLKYHGYLPVKASSRKEIIESEE